MRKEKEVIAQIWFFRKQYEQINPHLTDLKWKLYGQIEALEWILNQESRTIKKLSVAERRKYVQKKKD